MSVVRTSPQQLRFIAAMCDRLISLPLYAEELTLLYQLEDKAQIALRQDISIPIYEFGKVFELTRKYKGVLDYVKEHGAV